MRRGIFPEAKLDTPASHTFRFLISIRTKGLMVFVALIVYAIMIAIFAFHQKDLMLRDFEEIQLRLETETMLKQAEISAFHAVMAVFANVDAQDQMAGMQRIQLHYQSLLKRRDELAPRLPENALAMSAVDAAWEQLSANISRPNLDRLSLALIQTKDELVSLTEQIEVERRALSDHYRAQSDSVAMTTFLLGILGLALLGAIISLFFRRLTDDLRALQNSALKIVKGFRGEPMALTRHDEVGQLMLAVNDMAQALDQREKELMLERQKYFHQEKMAAIGTLAAGVAHEIGNPIAAISGIAQEMVVRRAENEKSCLAANCHDCRPEMIYAQTQRLAAITREISDFAAPRALEPEYLDLNGQLRSTSSLIRYDKRLDGVKLDLNLDSQLPAVYGVANQLTQLIMNLLINAMDALENLVGRQPTICISTSADSEYACVVIADNGHGIEPKILSRVFEAFFTTKPAGKGTGLGLSLCYSITKMHGGSIDIDSTPGAGTQVRVLFPLNDTAYSEANSL